MKGIEHTKMHLNDSLLSGAHVDGNRSGVSPGHLSHKLQCEEYRDHCFASGSSNQTFSMEWSVPADHLTRALRIMVRPAMIANAEGLAASKVAVEISNDTQCNSNDCNMWLYSPSAMASGLLIFGILPTGEITWTARVHLRGKPVSSRAGELSRPDAAGEIFTITRDFVKAFTVAVRI